MKFIYCTSSGKQPPKHPKRVRGKPWKYTIDIETLDELLDLVRHVDKPSWTDSVDIIISVPRDGGMPHIEVYDSYRE